MIMRIFILLIALSLSACSNTEIVVNDAKVLIPEAISKDEIQIERIQFKTLNTEARKALNAESSDALIAVFDGNVVTVYGAPDKAFKVVSKEPSDPESLESLKADGKELVSEVVIKTFVNSPECRLYLDDTGNGFWYPSGC